MKKFISNKYFAFSVGIIIIFLAWWIVSLCIEESVMIFPSPLKVIKNTFNILGGSYIEEYIDLFGSELFLSYFIVPIFDSK